MSINDQEHERVKAQNIFLRVVQKKEINPFQKTSPDWKQSFQSVHLSRVVPNLPPDTNIPTYSSYANLDLPFIQFSLDEILIHKSGEKVKINGKAQRSISDSGVLVIHNLQRNHSQSELQLYKNRQLENTPCSVILKAAKLCSQVILKVQSKPIKISLEKSIESDNTYNKAFECTDVMSTSKSPSSNEVTPMTRNNILLQQLPQLEGENTPKTVKVIKRYIVDPKAFATTGKLLNAAAVDMITEKQKELTYNKDSSSVEVRGLLVLCSVCNFCSRDLHRCPNCNSDIFKNAKIIPQALHQDVYKNSELISQKSGTTIVAKQSILTKPYSEYLQENKRQRKRPIRNKVDEVICISSDEEDTEKDNTLQDTAENRMSKQPEKEATPPSKKLRVWDPFDSEIYNDEIDAYEAKIQNPPDPTSLVPEMEKILLSSIAGFKHSGFECRSVRIGAYKIQKDEVKNNAVIWNDVSCLGVYVKIPEIFPKKSCSFGIPLDSIIIAEVCPRPRQPVLFLTVHKSYMSWLKEFLKIDEETLLNNSDGNASRRIGFLVQSYSEMNLTIFRQTFGTKLRIISVDDAHKILVRISMSQEEFNAYKKTDDKNEERQKNKNVTSTFAPNPATRSLSTCLENSKYQAILNYHSSVIHTSDIPCLGKEQFLNDTIITFWLKYILEEYVDEERRKRIHLFDSYFFEALTDKSRRRKPDGKLNAAEKKHDRVKKWTKNVNIFEKDFLIVPINEACHWYVAIVCFPGLDGAYDMDTGELIPFYEPPLKSRSKKKNDIPQEKTLLSENTPEKLPDSQIEEKNNTEKIDSESSLLPSAEITSVREPNATGSLKGNLKTQIGANLKAKRRIKTSCILIFDSLKKPSSHKVFNALRDYLKVEYKAKLGVEKKFNKINMAGMTAKVPLQTNYYDCGIFLLQYVESFFSDPLVTFGPVPSLKMWFENDKIFGKRKLIYQTIEDLVTQSCPDKLNLIPQLKFASLTQTEDVASPKQPSDNNDEECRLPSSDSSTSNSSLSSSNPASQVEAPTMTPVSPNKENESLLPHQVSASSSTSYKASLVYLDHNYYDTSLL